MSIGNSRVANIAVNSALAAALLWLAAGPRGPLTTHIAAWLRQRHQMSAIGERWADLTEAGLRIGSPSPDARVLVEFTDYQCPYCRQEHRLLDSLLAEQRDIAVVEHQFPLPIHGRAGEAAVAAVCAGRQGAFPTMNAFLFEDDHWYQEIPTDWAKVAQATAVEDTAAFLRCMVGDSAQAVVDSDMRLGHALDVNSTPTFVSRSGVLVGLSSADSLAALLSSVPR